MKKATVLILAVVILLIGMPFSVWAADGVTISADKTELVLGDTVTVTVTFNTSSDMMAFSYAVNFDQNVLEFSATSASESEYNLVEDGRLLYLAVTDGSKTVTETYTFNCVGESDTAVKVTDIYSADNEEYGYADVSYALNGAVKKLGDVNGDQAVNAVDLGNMKLYLSGVAVDINLLNSDFNNDGMVSSIDLAELKLVLVGT